MGFDKDYEALLDKNQTGRAGESLRRIKDGLGHAERMFLEKVWWPAVGNFDYLIPEFEVKDFKDGTRFLDFAYLRSPYRICFEIDAFGTHLKNIDRWQYEDHLDRQNDLMSDDWKVYRISYDKVREKPRLCQQSVQHILGKWYGASLPTLHLNMKEKRILQHMIHTAGAVTPGEISDLLEIGVKHARYLLRGLVDKGVLRPSAGHVRIRAYELDPDGGLPSVWYSV